MKLWVIAYDISDTKIRDRISNLLKNHGKRIQYSVFECWLTSQQLKTLRERLKKEIEPEDQIRWYPLCSWCASKTTWQGSGEFSEDIKYSII